MLGVVILAAAVAGLASHLEPVSPAVPVAHPGAVVQSAGDRSVQISESELTQALNQRLAGQTLGTTPLGPATLQRIDVKLSGGRIQVDGEARVGSTSVPVSVSVTGGVDNDRLLVSVDDARALGVSLPASTRGSLQRSIQAQVDAEVDRLQLRVKAVTVERGKLVLVGSPLFNPY